MVFEVSSSVTPIFAKIANERLFSSMNHKVLLEIVLVVKRFFTNHASERSAILPLCIMCRGMCA